MKNFRTTLKSLTILMTTFLMVASCSKDNEQMVTDPEVKVNDSETMAKNHTAGVKMYTAELSMLNESGVMGTAELWLDGDQLTVTIQASGIEPDMLHPQHIHGFTANNANATCPPMSADSNGDGLITLEEGLPFYGPVLLPLMPFPMAEDGTIDYTETFTVEGDVLPIQQNAIVLHGGTVDGLYVATLPVACGAIMPKRGR